MGRLGRATCTVHSISASGQPGGKRMYHYIREAKGGIMSEDIGGFLLLPKNVPKNYPKLLNPVHGNDTSIGRI